MCDSSGALHKITYFHKRKALGLESGFNASPRWLTRVKQMVFVNFLCEGNALVPMLLQSYCFGMEFQKFMPEGNIKPDQI
jgi:hypothetical protein